MGYVGPGQDYPAAQQGYGYMGMQQQQPQHNQYRQQPSGARLKVMRCVQLKAPESKRALLDFGLGVGVDLDRQVGDRGVMSACPAAVPGKACSLLCIWWGFWVQAAEC